MPALAYGLGAYRRDVAGLPELRVFNMYMEPSPISGAQPLLLTRPALALARDEGDTPTRAVFQRDGVLGGALITIGSGVRLDGLLIGSVAGSGVARVAAGEGEVLAATGGVLYRITATTVATVTFPDSAPVADVDFLSGRFLVVRQDTGKFYWSELLDGADIDALSFATAERQADPLVALRVVGDEVWLFGTETVEPWTSSGDADLPFVPVGGRVLSKGCINAACVAALDNSVFWVAPDRTVYRGGAAVPERVSTHGIEERLADATDFSAWAFTWRGHAFYCLRAEGVGTYLYDAATGQWSEWASYGATGWRAWVGQSVDEQVYCGSVEDGTIWRLTDDTSEDAGGAAIQRVFTALLPVQAGAVAVDNLELAASVGRAPISVDPQVEARLSRDGGFTWGPWRATSLGAQGRYRARPLWHRWGTADAPGYVFEFRLTDEAPFRVSGVLYNEAMRGLAR